MNVDLKIYGDSISEWLDKAPVYAFTVMDLKEGEIQTLCKAMLILKREATLLQSDRKEEDVNDGR